MAAIGFATGILVLVLSSEARDLVGKYARSSCGYTPHPIGDVAWELVDRGEVPIETALYYSRMMRSDNILFIECMEGKS